MKKETNPEFISLLSDDQRDLLVIVDKKIEDFKKLIRTIILSQDRMKFNCAMLQGPKGTGKTHNMLVVLNDLREEGLINQYNYKSGRVAPLSLYGILADYRNEKDITFLDDCDVLKDENSLNILKAAIDSKSPEKPRIVSYMSRANNSTPNFEYNGFVIMNSNENYLAYSDPHLDAVKDRIHFLQFNMTPYDIYIKNMSIIERYLNEEFEADYNTKLDLAIFLKTEIAEFIKYDVFAECNLSFSIRFAMKITDMYEFAGEMWKDYSMEYLMLKHKYEELKSKGLLGFTRPTKKEDQETSVEEAVEMGWKQWEGEWFKPIDTLIIPDEVEIPKVKSAREGIISSKGSIEIHEGDNF